MPRKRKYSDEEEWKDWGEKFGKRMEKRGKDFAEEMQDLGERFGRRMDRRDKEWKYRWFGVFGFIGPLIGSILGVVFLGILIWLLKFINLPLNSSFISSVSNFLFVNLHWFFAVFLFFGYSDYFSKRFHITFWIVSPITTSIGTIIVIWISTWVLNLINASVQSSLIASVSNFLRANLLSLFIIFLVLGYVIVIIKKLIMSLWRF